MPLDRDAVVPCDFGTALEGIPLVRSPRYRHRDYCCIPINSMHLKVLLWYSRYLSRYNDVKFEVW